MCVALSENWVKSASNEFLMIFILPSVHWNLDFISVVDSVHHTSSSAIKIQTILKCPEIWYWDFIQKYYHFKTGKFINKLQTTKDYFIHKQTHGIIHFGSHVFPVCSTVHADICSSIWSFLSFCAHNFYHINFICGYFSSGNKKQQQ